MGRFRLIWWTLGLLQHDRMAFQQNTVNELVISALTFQQAASQQSISSLERRIQALESEVASLRGNTPP